MQLLYIAELLKYGADHRNMTRWRLLRCYLYVTSAACCCQDTSLAVTWQLHTRRQEKSCEDVDNVHIFIKRASKCAIVRGWRASRAVAVHMRAENAASCRGYAPVYLCYRCRCLL